MDGDDEQVGRLLTRREALALLGFSGATLFVAGGAAADPEGLRAVAGSEGFQAVAASQRIPACVVRPEQTEGPFFVDRMLDRSDIRADPASGRMSEGVPLVLSFAVSRLGDGVCAPLEGAQVDVWQCDAMGAYSGVQDRRSSAQGQAFLRGFQRTDAAGMARFTTIYPGWYQGRAVHVHFKIRTDPDASRGSEFVSQLYFDDALTDRVHGLQPYADHGKRDRRNADDGIFRRGGDQLMLSVTERPEGGYTAAFEVGLQL